MFGNKLIIKLIFTLVFANLLNANELKGFYKFETKECTILVPNELKLTDKNPKYDNYTFENDLHSIDVEKLVISYHQKKNIEFIKKFNLSKKYEMIVDENKGGLLIYGFQKYSPLEHKYLKEFNIFGKKIDLYLVHLDIETVNKIVDYCIQTKK